MKIRLLSLLLFAGLFSINSLAQTDSPEIDHLEPPFWWVGMVDPSVQLLVHGENISEYDVEIKTDFIILDEVIIVENPNYLFLNLTIPVNAQPGSYEIVFKNGKDEVFHHHFDLKNRTAGSSKREGFDASDVIYLLMPDRFANGDLSNDNVSGMLEGVDRSNPLGRHGGDLQGIINHLDYLQNLGITALWLNPFVENDNPSSSYHGYAITDFYNTDPRFGTNETYLTMVNECHKRGIKVIMDQVFNHSSGYHWFIKDLPAENWIHQFPEYTRSNFRAPTLTDPYASDFDQTRMLTGWFDRNMPDLDQRNEMLTNYLIQNSIWWIEFANLDGIRLDTQPYAYKEMVAKWGERVFMEYPEFKLLGENWMQKIAITAYFQGNANNPDAYNSHVASVTDFPMHYTLIKAFQEDEGWTTGMARLYYHLAQDFLYAHPEENVIFLDNHDLSRFYSSVDEDMDIYKMALAYLLTTRGIPMIYYGTEIVKTGFEHDGHGEIRTDFPGGWPDDEMDAFIPEGRSKKQAEAYDYTSMLLNWRKSKDVIHNGRLTHYVPEDGVYVLFRYNEEESVMIILNNNKKKKEITTERFAENLDGYRSGYNIITDKKVKKLSKIEIPGKSTMIVELAR